MNEESGEVGVPIAKEDDDRGSQTESDRSAAKQYRQIVAKMNYLRQDSQIQFAVKELTQELYS